MTEVNEPMLQRIFPGSQPDDDKAVDINNIGINYYAPNPGEFINPPSPRPPVRFSYGTPIPSAITDSMHAAAMSNAGSRIKYLSPETPTPKRASILNRYAVFGKQMIKTFGIGR